MLSTVDRISYKQRQILIHSHIYYNLNRNIMADQEYDRLAYNLVDLIKQHPEEFKQSDYFKHFIGFDGTTGFDLLDKLSGKERFMVEQIASYLCRGKATKKK